MSDHDKYLLLIQFHVWDFSFNFTRPPSTSHDILYYVLLSANLKRWEPTNHALSQLTRFVSAAKKKNPVYSLFLCAKTLHCCPNLSQTHNWATLLYWVTCFFIITNVGAVVLILINPKLHVLPPTNTVYSCLSQNYSIQPFLRRTQSLWPFVLSMNKWPWARVPETSWCSIGFILWSYITSSLDCALLIRSNL